MQRKCPSVYPYLRVNGMVRFVCSFLRHGALLIRSPPCVDMTLRYVEACW